MKPLVPAAPPTATAEVEKFKALIERNRELEGGETTAEAAETTAEVPPCASYFLQVVHRQFDSISGNGQIRLLNGIL
jgi:hypothetical protein